MNVLVTNDIKITVDSRYEEAASNPSTSKFIHSYQVTIENLGTDTVQLMERFWSIQDAEGEIREVRGPGVIGIQPIIKSGESHSYSSWSVIRTPLGKMNGYYTMHNLTMDPPMPFAVKIPEFKLIANYVNN